MTVLIHKVLGVMPDSGVPECHPRLKSLGGPWVQQVMLTPHLASRFQSSFRGLGTPEGRMPFVPPPTAHLCGSAVCWRLGTALPARGVMDLPHHRVTTQGVPGKEHWLRDVTHEPLDDVPHSQGGLGRRGQSAWLEASSTQRGAHSTPSVPGSR